MSGDPRLPELFAAAHELEGEARERFLAGLATEAPALAAEIRALLAVRARGERRLSGAAWERLSELPREVPPLPERLGPYRILSELGRGGMGRVFLADEIREAFQRRVALKVIDRPWVSPNRLRRFRDEVRILATLEHPGIARFLDGGTLPDGTWFLALEHVDGEDLLSHCERNTLPVAERVRLIAEVLSAVAYAHARGIVHRDLKPANILVDREGRTRLLDFGVAKLLDADEPPESLVATEPELRVFTPAYASPEQFAGEPVQAASDIYSAGVVLYELLSGTRPFDDAATSRAELERAVLGSIPAPPSSRTRTRPGGSRPASDPAASPRSLLSVPRDLDAICLKALRRRPAERYGSAREMAGDLERFLRAEPVAARRGERAYRLRHALQRAPWRVLAALAAIVALGWLLLARRPDAPPADPAPHPFPYSAADAPPLEELQRRFDGAPASLSDGAALALGLEREQRPEEAALVLARLRQIPGGAEDPLVDYVEASLEGLRGAPQNALILFERALQRARATGRGELVAQIRASYGRLLATLGRRAEARREMAAAADAFEQAADQGSLARVLNDLAIESAQRNDLAEASRLFEGALVATRAVSPANSGATFITNLGLIERLRGHPDRAAARFREAVALFRQMDRPFKLAWSLGELSIALWAEGRSRDAIATADEAIALGAKGPAASSLSEILLHRARMAIEGGEPQLADRLLERLDTMVRETGRAEDSANAETLRGELAAARGVTADSLARLGAARRLLTSSGASDRVVFLDLEIGVLRLKAGDRAGAREAAAGVTRALAEAEEHSARLAAELFLGRLDASEGQLAEARLRIDRFAGLAERSSDVELRLAALAARAQLALGEGEEAGARALVGQAVALAERSGRFAQARALAR